MLSNTKLLGKYNIIKEIGRGGMGIVYKAEDQNLERFVAIKELVLSKLLEDDEKKDIVERFKREALSAASLSHPNIITIFDVGQNEESHFIAMEYVNGPSLKDLIDKNHTFNLSDIVDMMIQVANGLEHAHSKGVIHRDVKPDNIRILEDNTVKIMDFGIAGFQKKNKRLTEDGSILGTIGYISPEQLYNPKDADSRSDIFSYGVMFYEVLTGNLPFASDSIGEAIMNIMQKDPKPIKETIPNIPQQLDELILKCLEKDPAKRYERFKNISNELMMLKFLIMNSEAGEFKFSFNNDNRKVSNTLAYEQAQTTQNNKINSLINDNNLDISLFNSHKIAVKFNKVIGSYGELSGQFSSPRGIYISKNNLLLVADTKNSRVQVFNIKGEYQTEIKYNGMLEPCSITEDNEGNIYILDAQDCKVRVFDKNNDFIFEFAGKGENKEQLISASSIAFLADNRIYISDSEQGLIKIFDTKGNFIKNINNDYKSPYSLAIYNEKLISLDNGIPKIQISSKEGRAISHFGKRGLSVGEFTVPRCIATDKFGFIYVTEKLTHRVQIFKEDGTYIYSFGKKGTKNQEFFEPEGIAISNNLMVFVVDRGNNRIQIFDIIEKKN
ncbi:MAG: protein kinase [Candidatus Sericytochromatia bacterium]